MKRPIAAAAIILAAGAGLGWHNHRQLVAANEIHAQLVAEAATLGISPDPARLAAPNPATRRERQHPNPDAKLVAAELIAFARELTAHQKARTGADDADLQKRILVMLDRLMALDASQLKTLIAEVGTATDLSDDARNGLLSISIMQLADSQPQAALTLCIESAALFKDDRLGGHVLSPVLALWAKTDPLAALEWVRTKAPKHPDLITDDAKRGLLSGTAVQDPALAFKLIGELGFKDTNNAISNIVNVANTPEERTATLAALRTHLATLTDDAAKATASTRAVSALVGSSVHDGFASASQWLNSARLTPDELAGVADTLTNSPQLGETGQWLEWLGANLAPDKAGTHIARLVDQWTQTDYQAAGNWLGSAAAGSSKNIAIRAYATTLSRYEPEAAAQWALTLPPGKDRDETLNQIYHAWPKTDPAAIDAAAAFARQHGLK